MRIKACLTCGILVCFIVAANGCPPPREPVLRLLFNQGTYGTTAGYSEMDWSDFFSGEQQLGDDFELTGDNTTITHVSWWGVYRDNLPVTDDFMITISQDNGAGMPDVGGFWEHRIGDLAEREATSGRVGPGDPGWSLTIYHYSCEIPDWEMEPGATYFVSIVNDTGKWMWCTNGSAAEGNNFSVARESWGDAWGANGLDLTFQLWGSE